jgi:hypothetical protein
MSVESASSIQKSDSDDSIVACQQDAADFFDNIDPSGTAKTQKIVPSLRADFDDGAGRR